MTELTEPITFARAIDCPAGQPIDPRAAGWAFARNTDVTQWLTAITGEGHAVVIAPSGWRPPPGPSGYRLTLLCPDPADWRRLTRLRTGDPR